jgi:adenosylcobinamide-GDP ribazoletransferase
MKRLILLIQFLTRIPININLDVTREDLSKSIIYFPIVGYIIGIILAVFYKVSIFYFDKIIISFLIVTFEIVITGGLHIDGLSDTVDGIYSGRKKEKIIEIMKDPNVGTFGVLSIIILMIFKFLLIYKINNNLFIVLLIMPVFSRFCSVLSSRIGKYSKEDGLGNIFIGQVSNFQLFISFILTLPLLYFNFLLYFAFIINIVFTILFVKYISKKIDGITGDTLGAIVEINEVLFLMIIYIMEVL